MHVGCEPLRRVGCPLRSLTRYCVYWCMRATNLHVNGHYPTLAWSVEWLACVRLAAVGGMGSWWTSHGQPASISQPELGGWARFFGAYRVAGASSMRLTSAHLHLHFTQNGNLRQLMAAALGSCSQHVAGDQLTQRHVARGPDHLSIMPVSAWRVQVDLLHGPSPNDTWSQNLTRWPFLDYNCDACWQRSTPSECARRPRGGTAAHPCNPIASP